jgi:hypothetical protein
MARQNEGAEEREQRKAAKKATKEQQRLKREGRAGPGVGQKPCTLCDRPRDLLIRWGWLLEGGGWGWGWRGALGGGGMPV